MHQSLSKLKRFGPNEHIELPARHAKHFKQIFRILALDSLPIMHSVMIVQPRQMATAQESNVLYHPSGSVIQMLQIGNGDELGILRGHMDTVHACAFNPVAHELYTGGSDCQLLAWSAPDADVPIDKDNWSDSE